jgi:hypothetical protein
MNRAEWKALYLEWQENMDIATSIRYRRTHTRAKDVATKERLSNLDGLFLAKCEMFERFFHTQFGHYDFAKELA